MSRRYKIIDMLSQDGSGVAYLAHDKESDSEVVLRRFFPFGPNGGGLSPEDAATYEKSVDKLKGLSRPTLRNVLDGGADPLDGMPYLVSESLGGRPLLHRLQEVTFEPDVAKMVLRLAIESSIALSELFGEEGVWIETDSKGIMLHPDREDREVTFRISPMRWIAGDTSRQGLSSLLRLGEEITGWGSRIVSGNAGEGLGKWIQTLRNNSDQWTLKEALDELLVPGSSVKSKSSEPTKPTAAPVIRPPGAPRRKSEAKSSPTPTVKPAPAPASEAVVTQASSAAKTAAPVETAAASQGTTSTTQPSFSPTGQMVINSGQSWDGEIKVSRWPWFAGAAAAVAILSVFAWWLTRDPYGGDVPAVAQEENEQADSSADDPLVLDLAPDAGPAPEPKPQIQRMSNRVEPSKPALDPRTEPVNARLIQIGKAMQDKVGQEVELEAMKVLSFNHASGMLEFGTIRGPNAICGVISKSPDRQSGIRKIMKDLVSQEATVKLNGKVVKLDNERIAIEIFNDKNVVVGSVKPTPPKPAPPKTTPKTTPPKPALKVDPKTNALVVDIGKSLRSRIDEVVGLEPMKVVAFENGLLEFGTERGSDAICGWVDITPANPRSSLQNLMRSHAKKGTWVLLNGKVVKTKNGRIAIHINMGHNALDVDPEDPAASISRQPKTKPQPQPTPQPKPQPKPPNEQNGQGNKPPQDLMALALGQALSQKVGSKVKIGPMKVVGFDGEVIEFGNKQRQKAICGSLSSSPQRQKGIRDALKKLSDEGANIWLQGKVVMRKDKRIAIEILSDKNFEVVQP